jgi:uncharacterized protein (DUF2147 family)
MKFKLLVIILFLVTFLTPDLYSGEADKVLGYWLTQNGDSQVKIFKEKEGKYYGNIKWLKIPNREDGSIKLDDNNPNEELSKKTILNLQLLKSFEFDEDDNEWVNGTIYDPTSGKTYKCYMWFEDGDYATLHVKGFIGFSAIGSRVDWTRESKLRE